MKVRITMKDPDGIYECVRDAVKESRPPGLADEEWEALEADRVRALTHSRWIDCGDYITVEIDTGANTATVIPVK